MSEPAQTGKTCDLRGIREAVCVHTGKITDSCLAKDCIEDLRVYLTVDSQQTLDCAASAKARYVELLFTQVQVEPVPYSRRSRPDARIPSRALPCSPSGWFCSAGKRAHAFSPAGTI